MDIDIEMGYERRREQVEDPDWNLNDYPGLKVNQPCALVIFKEPFKAK